MMGIIGGGKKVNCKHVGVMVSPQVYSYLALHALANKTSSSEHIRQMVELWMVKQRAAESDLKLVQKVIQRYLASFTIDKVSFDVFLKSVKTELKRKGVAEEYINLILSGIEDNAKNNK
jgi:Arc/MetJ-type ribon-helix-helix transcriptional regulator